MLYRKLPRISRAYSRLLTTEPVGLSRVPHTETLHLNTNQFCPSIKLLRTTAMAPVGEVKESGSPISKAPRLEKQCEGETYPEVTEELPPNSTNVILRFAKLTENALTPTRGSKLAAGYDLYSAYDYVIPAKGKVLAKTDIQIALPDGCYGRVAPRSGLAHKHFIDVGAGVIDQDYRGNVGVIMFNFGEDEFKVNKGDRVAQLILEKIFLPDLEELPTLDATERGEGGFGSTGKN